MEACAESAMLAHTTNHALVTMSLTMPLIMPLTMQLTMPLTLRSWVEWLAIENGCARVSTRGWERTVAHI